MIDVRAIDDGLVERYARRFFGFGSPRAPYWLVAPEPLDDRTASAARIEAWRSLGEPGLTDVAAFETALAAAGVRSEPGRSLGPGLPPLLRIVLDAFGEPCAPFDVDRYLRTRAGKTGDRLALVHLFALPLRRTGRWDAHEISRLVALRSRTAFVEEFAAERLRSLGASIAAAAPRLVLMVGNVWGTYWERLAGGPLALEPDVPLRWRRGGGTLFVQIAQPDVAGSPNATRSGAVAAFLRERVGGVRNGRGE